ncbi:MAG: hypothetical protein KC416_09630 [Myxococcales bacterium]|nr:hypothetical protein [Myxococcales bacterium]
MTLRRLMLVGLPLAFGNVAAAQPPPPPKGEASPAVNAAYPGVAPGHAYECPPIPERMKTHPHITWSGFQRMADGGTRVFLQVTAEVTPESGWKKDKFVVTLPGTKVYLRNNRLPLDTRFFNTPVNNTKIRRHKKDTVVELTMRKKVAPTVRYSHGQGGYWFIFLEFPKGDYGVVDVPMPTHTSQGGGGYGRVAADGSKEEKEGANSDDGESLPNQDDEKPPNYGEVD